MMDLSGKHIPDNRELFAFLAGEQMGIPHGHGDVLMAHELLQFHECDLAGLCQPGCERMPHGMQCDHIQTVAVFWSDETAGVCALIDPGDESSCGAAGRWVPQVCAYTPGASGSCPQVLGRKHACRLSE